MTPTVVNQTLTSADTEYSVALTRVRFFRMRCRTAADVRFAFATGKVAGPTAPYETMKSGTVYESPIAARDELIDGTLYLANAAGSVVVELELWR